MNFLILKYRELSYGTFIFTKISLVITHDRYKKKSVQKVQNLILTRRGSNTQVKEVENAENMWYFLNDVVNLE